MMGKERQKQKRETVKQTTGMTKRWSSFVPLRCLTAAYSVSVILRLEVYYHESAS